MRLSRRIRHRPVPPKLAYENLIDGFPAGKAGNQSWLRGLHLERLVRQTKGLLRVEDADAILVSEDEIPSPDRGPAAADIRVMLPPRTAGFRRQGGPSFAPNREASRPNCAGIRHEAINHDPGDLRSLGSRGQYRSPTGMPVVAIAFDNQNISRLGGRNRLNECSPVIRKRTDRQGWTTYRWTL